MEWFRSSAEAKVIIGSGGGTTMRSGHIQALAT
jgi:hypothetical protein